MCVHRLSRCVGSRSPTSLIDDLSNGLHHELGLLKRDVMVTLLSHDVHAIRGQTDQFGLQRLLVHEVRRAIVVTAPYAPRGTATM